VSVIWDRLIECKDEIINIFDASATEFDEPGLAHFNSDTWVNRVWRNEHVRRAHIDVVDARESKGLWMMHVCVFPVIQNDGPIYGFDVIAGKNKMTGAFHDFSPSADHDNPMIDGYKEAVTDKMLAAGNVSDIDEAVAIITLAQDNLRAYFDEIGEFTGSGNSDMVIGAQNYYCHNQQQNPHTPRTMKSLGLDEADVDKFCTDMLFPKIV
jgi:hypothetical protein